MPVNELYLGLDVGGTKCAAVLGDPSGRVHARREWASCVERGPGAMIGDLIAYGRAVVEAQRGERSVHGIGVSIGGPLNADAGLILSPPNLPGWDRVPLGEQLEAAFELPVTVEHDAAACALAESRWGSGPPRHRLAYLTCGTGFGVGLVVDGKPYHGANGGSPEIGHVRYRDDGPRAFSKVGCFEAFAAGSALPGLAAWMNPTRWADQPPSSKQINKLWQCGDIDAASVIDQNARAVGEACALIGDLLRPEAIRLGSLARYLGPRWVSRVQRRFTDQALPAVARSCTVEPAHLAETLQDRSAIAVACGAPQPNSVSPHRVDENSSPGHCEKSEPTSLATQQALRTPGNYRGKPLPHRRGSSK